MPKTLDIQGFSGLREEVVRSEGRPSCSSVLQALKSIRFIPENSGFRGFLCLFITICKSGALTQFLDRPQHVVFCPEKTTIQTAKKTAIGTKTAIKVAMEMAIKSDRYNTGVKADPCVFVCLINFVASESHFWATARPAVSTGRCVPE